MYDAFISYRRADGDQVVHWLRRELQSFKAPRAFEQLRGRRLKIYVDTAYERGTSDFYAQNIRPALLSSRFLIVVATPLAVTRADSAADWIAREIDDFASGPNGENILVVRGAGGFLDALPGDLALRFPNIEVVDLRGAGRFSLLNPLKTNRLSGELLKLVAPLLDVPSEAMPRLRLEEERRQQMKLGAIAGVAATFLLIATTAATVSVTSLRRAQEAIRESLLATERVVAAIDDALPVEADSPGTRSAVLNQICDLRSRLEAEAAAPGELAEHLVCELERARGHEEQKELVKAERSLQLLAEQAQAQYDKRPSIRSALAVIEALWAQAGLAARQPSLGGDAQLLRNIAGQMPVFDKAYDGNENYLNGLERIDRSRAQLAYLEGDAAANRKDEKAAIGHVIRSAAILEGIRYPKSADPGRAAKTQLDIAELHLGVAAYEWRVGNKADSQAAKIKSDRLINAALAAVADDKDLKSRAQELRQKHRELP